jgi:hypothetical protein
MKPATVGGALPIKPISIDINVFRKHEATIHNFIKENPFKPLWNPHKEDTISSKKRFTRRKTRKTHA